MKVLRVILLLILLLAIIAVILGLTGPKEVSVERSVTIEAQPAMVYPYVSSFERMRAWSPWAELDSNMETSLDGEDGNVGTTQSWSGNSDVGKGSQTITALQPNSTVNTHLEFVEPFASEADAQISLTPQNGSTEVSWSLISKTSFFERLLSYFMDFEGNINQSYDKGLAKLKTMVETDLTREYRGYKVHMIDWPGQVYMAYREEIPMDQMEGFYIQHLTRLANAVGRAGVEMTGMPCGLYYTWDEEQTMTDMAAAIPVSAAFAGRRMEAIEIPAGKALQIDHYGSYEGLGEAHAAMDEFMTNFQLDVNVPVIEEYASDPDQEPDTSKWLTKIYYLLKSN
jgi:effector-binding domain-containing protein